MKNEIAAVEPWVIAAALLLLGLVAVKIISVLIRKTLKKTSVDPILHKFIGNGIAAVCLIALIGTLLSYVGIPLSTIITMLGVIGAAIALALKDSLGNVAGGIIVIISKPFKKGDFIEVSGVSGTVDQIDLLFTTIMTIDNKVVYIPNGNLSTSIIINASAEGKRRVDCKFKVSSACSIPEAKEILMVVAEQDDRIFRVPEPVIGVAEQSDGIVVLDMKVWCATGDLAAVRYYLEENVKIALDEAGIETRAPYIWKKL